MVCRDGDPAYLVDWYFADEGAKVLELWTPFRSRNWDERFGVDGELGEQPGERQWKNGKKPDNGFTGSANALACAIAHSDWWEDGLGIDEETGPFEGGIPVCCIDGPTPPPILLCECTTPQAIKVTFGSPLNPCFDGVEINLDWNETFGQWNNFGTEPVLCGDCLVQVVLACVDAFPTQWFLSLCFTGPPSCNLGCAGGSDSILFTSCVPMSGTLSVFAGEIDPTACGCNSGVVIDTVTYSIEVR